MLFRLTALAVLLTSAFAADSPFPAGYWERGYATGLIPAASYTVSLKVDSISRAETEIDRRMSRFGGKLTSLNGNQFYGGYNNQNMRSKMIQYQLDLHRAEAAAKGLFDLGDLQQFSHQMNRTDNQYGEIKQKLKQVQEEIDRHADELRKMPVANYFLTTQRDRLIQSRDAYESGAHLAMINVTLLEGAGGPNN